MEIKNSSQFLFSNCQISTVLSDVVVVLLLRLLIKLNWSWWWETTGQGREFGAGAGGGPWAESVSSEPRGRHRHKQQHPESHKLASVLFQSQTIIIDLSVTRNLSMYINVVQNAQSSKSFANCERYFSNNLVKKTYLCQNRRMSGLYKKNFRRFFSGTLSIWLDWMNCFCGLFVS